MADRIRQKDIAMRAGVTVATVSHALLGTGNISDKTRAQIVTIAKELGYEEDPLMSALARYRNRTSRHEIWTHIAVVFPEDPHLDWRKAPDQKRLLSGISNAAKKWKFRISTFSHDGSAQSCEEISRTLFNRGIKGVLLALPRPWEKETPRTLDWDRFITIACKPMFGQNQLSSITTDHFANGRMLYRKLHEKGYRRVGLYFSQGLDLISNSAFRAGVTIEHQLLDKGSSPLPCKICTEWHFSEFERWLHEHNPDCIISQREQLLVWLKQLGRHIPKDIGIAVPSTFSGSFQSGMDQNYQQIGEEAVSLLREQMALGNRGVPQLPLQLVVPSTWYDGCSLL